MDPDEAEGLIPTHISSRVELNEWEQANIVQGERWAFSQQRINALTVHFVKQLHRRMFGETWRWAGQFRTSEKTIGIAWWQITEALSNLCEDAKCWYDERIHSPDETAARFHHRLTLIHPFPNGNGRHARLATDVLLTSHGRPRFTWGRTDLHGVGENRERYIAALRAADGQDFEPLFDFLQLSSRLDLPIREP